MSQPLAPRRQPPSGPIEDADAFASAEATPQIFGGEAPEAETAPEEAWTDERLQALLQAEMAAAVSYYDSDVAPKRTEGSQYYDGEPFGDEEEGRSSIISRDVRDTVRSIMPSLLRIFLGGEKWGEFAPAGPDDEEGAKQRTEYLQVVAFKDNPGFRIFRDWFEDALVRMYGVVKWWWEEKEEVTSESYTGLLEEQVMLLANDPEITIDTQAEGAPVTMPDGQTAPTYYVTLTRRRRSGQARYAVIPGEEFYINPSATSLETATIVSHVRKVTRSDLVAMGYSLEFLEEHEGTAFDFALKEEYLARHPAVAGLEQTENPDLQETLYGEHLIRFDQDGDGVAELYRICTLGTDYFVVNRESAPEIPFALLCPDPTAHKLFGGGIHQLVGDLQRIKSAILRAVMDSLRGSIDPRIAANEDYVDMNDLLNNEVGGIIRTTGDPNTVLRDFVVPFAGQAGLQVLEYLDTVKESRSGQSRGSQGLDAGAMQSTTVMGIAAQLSAAQQQIEMIARIFAETGVKDLFLGLQRLLSRHQDVARMVKLRGGWTQVDPRTWSTPLDLDINVGLGMGLPAERLATLGKIAEKQELAISTIGPSPLVGYEHLSHTYRRMVETAGYRPESFFGVVPPNWAPPAPQTPDPATILAQAQAQEIQAKLQIEQAKLEMARQKQVMEMETARMKIEAEIQLEVLKIEAQHGIQIEENRVSAAVEQSRIAAETAARRYEADRDVEARRHEAETAALAQAATPKESTGS